jgi:hypothetical protein
MKPVWRWSSEELEAQLQHDRKPQDWPWWWATIRKLILGVCDVSDLIGNGQQQALTAWARTCVHCADVAVCVDWILRRR